MYSCNARAAHSISGDRAPAVCAAGWRIGGKLRNGLRARVEERIPPGMGRRGCRLTSAEALLRNRGPARPQTARLMSFKVLHHAC